MFARLRTGLESIAAALLLAAVFLNFANVVGRYLFGRPIVTTEEILQYADVWIVMLGAAAVTAQNLHLRMDVLIPRGRWALHRALEIFIALLGIAVAVYVCRNAAEIIDLIWMTGQRSVAAGIPLVVVHLAVPVGFICTALFLILRLARLVRGAPVDEA